MKYLMIVFLFIGLQFSCFATAQSTEKLTEIYNSLDITTFRSSLLPKRSGEQSKLPEFENLPKPRIENDSIILENDMWYYNFQLKKENKKGYYFCFIDKANMGTYSKEKSLLLR